jgi:hypothetical protein
MGYFLLSVIFYFRQLLSPLERLYVQRLLSLRHHSHGHFIPSPVPQLFLVQNVISVTAIAPNSDWPLGATTVAQPVYGGPRLAPVAPLASLPNWATIGANKASLHHHSFHLATTKAVHAFGPVLTTIITGTPTDGIDETKSESTPLRHCRLCHLRNNSVTNNTDRRLCYKQHRQVSGFGLFSPCSMRWSRFRKCGTML